MTSPSKTLAQPTSSEGAGKTLVTIGYYAACAALGLVSASLGPTLPGLAEHTRAQLSQISLVFTARSTGYLIGSFQGGRLYDRLPGHPLLMGGLIIMAAMMVLTPLISLPWLLIAVWLLVGTAEGSVDVGVNTLLMWLHRDNLGPFMNGLHFFFGVGAFVSPIIVAGAVAATGDITWANWTLALLIVPMIVWLARLPSPVVQGTSPDGPAGRSNYGLVILTALLLFFYVGTESSFGGWIYTYAVELDLAGKAAAAYLTSAFWGALTIGRLLSIPIAMRFRPGTILLADLVGCVVSVGLILLLPSSPAATWLGTLGLGISMASVFPVALSLAQSRMPITGVITGWFFVGSSAGGMTLPWVIGQLFEPLGPHITMVVIMVDLVMALGIFALLMHHSTCRVTSTG